MWMKIGKNTSAKVQNGVFMGTVDESERESPFGRLPPLQHLPPIYHTHHSPPPHPFSPLPLPPSACTFSAPPVTPPDSNPPGLSCHRHHYQPPPSMENPIPKPPERVITMVPGQDVVSYRGSHSNTAWIIVVCPLDQVPWSEQCPFPAFCCCFTHIAIDSVFAATPNITTPPQYQIIHHCITILPHHQTTDTQHTAIYIISIPNGYYITLQTISAPAHRHITIHHHHRGNLSLVS